MGVIETLRTESAEVLYRNSSLFTLDSSVFNELRQRAELNPRQRARICLHDNSNSPVHEMLILHRRGTYIQPHRHAERDEALISVVGEADLVFFDNNGAVKNVTHATELSGAGCWYNRIDAGAFHTLVIRSEWFMFLEVTSGPFKPNTTERASWAPSEMLSDGILTPEAVAYLASLEGLAASHVP